MKRKHKQISNYRVHVYWSNEDSCYVAESEDDTRMVATGSTIPACLTDYARVLRLWMQTEQEGKSGRGYLFFEETSHD